MIPLPSRRLCNRKIVGWRSLRCAPDARLCSQCGPSARINLYEGTRRRLRTPCVDPQQAVRLAAITAGRSKKRRQLQGVTHAELTPETITDAVLDQMATTPDLRLKTIMAAAVKHLHAFAREVNLTPAEWIKGIEFMTAAGKMCSPERQEFILLSDTLGLSALVNGLHDATAAGGSHPHQPARPVLPRGHADAGGRQLDRQKSEAGERMRALWPRHRCHRQAGRRRHRLDLADRRRRSLRHSGQRDIGRLSRRVRNRCGRHLCAAHRETARILDSRWTGLSAPW